MKFVICWKLKDESGTIEWTGGEWQWRLLHRCRMMDGVEVIVLPELAAIGFEHRGMPFEEIPVSAEHEDHCGNRAKSDIQKLISKLDELISAIRTVTITPRKRGSYLKDITVEVLREALLANDLQKDAAKSIGISARSMNYYVKHKFKDELMDCTNGHK